MKMFTTLFASLMMAIFIGCGGGSSSSSSDTFTAQLVDSPIAGVTYTCGDITGITDVNGMFTCKQTPVTFSIGNLRLGIINDIPSDNKILPQDLVHVSRSKFLDQRLMILTQLLQSMDSDGNISNSITIADGSAAKINQCYSEVERFWLIPISDLNAKLQEYTACMGITEVIDGESAIENLKEYYNTHIASSSSSSSSANGGGGSVSSNATSSDSSSVSSANSSAHSSQNSSNRLWDITLTYEGHSSFTRSWKNIEIASRTDTLKNAPDWKSYPFPTMGGLGSQGIVLIDTGYYDKDSLGLIYYQDSMALADSGYCIVPDFISEMDDYDTLILATIACSDSAIGGDEINMHLSSSQADAFENHQLFSVSDSGDWVNLQGTSTLSVTFTPIQ